MLQSTTFFDPRGCVQIVFLRQGRKKSSKEKKGGQIVRGCYKSIIIDQRFGRFMHVLQSSDRKPAFTVSPSASRSSLPLLQISLSVSLSHTQSGEDTCKFGRTHPICLSPCRLLDQKVAFRGYGTCMDVSQGTVVFHDFKTSNSSTWLLQKEVGGET